MTNELKTLKDLPKFFFANDEKERMGEDCYLKSTLRQEAIKWVKELEFRRRYQETPLKELHEKSLIESERWIKYFFNITEEELK